MRQAFSHLSESCDTAGLHAWIGAEQWEKLKNPINLDRQFLANQQNGGMAHAHRTKFAELPPDQFFQASIVKLPGA